MSLFDDLIDELETSTALTTVSKMVTDTGHAARGHVVHSASVAERFWNCPGSIQLSDGIPNTSSSHAALGTAAHELIEMCLRSGEDASVYMDTEINGIVVDEKMVSGAQMHLDTVHPYMGEGWVYFIESKVSLELLGPPVPMAGTADFVAYNAELRLLVVVDYKNGVGYVSEVNNKQTRYYALGTYLGLPPGIIIEMVEMIIVQPNAKHGRLVKRETITFTELIDWGFELIERARATLVPNAEIKSGDWCKWCPAKGLCPVRAEARITEAQIDFAELIAPDPPVKTMMTTCTPDLKVLSVEQLGRIYLAKSRIEKFLEDVEAAVIMLSREGVEVPNTKVVEVEGSRAWVGNARLEELIEFLRNDLKLPDDKIFTKPKVVTVKQIEDAFVAARKTKGVTKKSLESQFNEVVKGFVHRPKGTKVVSVEDTREAVTTPAIEFEVIEHA